MIRDPLGDAFELRTIRAGFAMHTLVAIILCFVPLFDVLGFERAFISGLLSAPIGAAVGVAMVKSARLRGGDDLARIAAHASGISFLMLIPTLVAGVIVELVTQPCDQQEGILFLMLVGGGNALFGTALGVVAATITERRFGPLVLITLALLSSIALALHRLYAEPQIYIFSMPFGYWPGSLYDEELEVSRALWAFRGYTLLVALAIVAAARTFVDPARLKIALSQRPRPTAFVSTLILGFAAFTARASGESLGFDRDRSTIERELSRHVETPHFELMIEPSISAEGVKQLVEDHELRYAQLARYFGFAPKQRIKSFIYETEEQKRRLMGASGTQIARPWANEIHINGFSVPHPVLKHELAHVFAGQVALGPFKVPANMIVLVNIGIVEGLAVAADWPANELTVHEWTRTMRELKLAPDMRKTLDAFGFWSISSARAYTVAGSFVRWLADTHGMEKLSKLYATNDFDAAYGESLDKLVSSWEAFLDALPLPKNALAIAEHRFKRPGIFQKVCAHRAANLSKLGYQRLRSGDLDGGIDHLQQLLAYSPANTQPLIDIAAELAKVGRIDEARAYVKRALETPNLTSKSEAEAKEAMASLDWRTGAIDRAREGYQLVLDRHLSMSSDRLQIARLAALTRPPDTVEVMRPLLLGDLSGAKAIVKLGAVTRAQPEDGLARYLYARQLEGAAAWEEGAEETGAAIEHGLPGEPLEHEAELMLGRLLLRAGKRAEAAERFEAFAGRAPTEVLRLLASDWAERARFGRTGPE